MTTDSDRKDDTLKRFKVMTSVEKIVLIEGMVDALLDNLKNVEGNLAQAKIKKDAADRTATGQMSALIAALADYAEPVTEEVWEKVYRANVAERLGDSKKEDGSLRFASNASRDVMINTLKVATMGITLAKQDSSFSPSWRARTNLKKYADEVRPLLQAAIDPATGKARLRSIIKAPKAPQKLPDGVFYWLIGCEKAESGIEGANTVLCADFSLEKLKTTAKSFRGEYQSFLYCLAELTDLEVVEAEPVEHHPIQNAAVFAGTAGRVQVPA